MKLTTENLQQLADKIADTSTNVYSAAKLMFGEAIQVDDETFDRLQSECDLFRCEECNFWQSTNELAAGMTACCIDCMDERDSDDEEDDED